MRVYAVTPIHVSPEELARRQARYDALCPAGLAVELHDVGPDAPGPWRPNNRSATRRDWSHERSRGRPSTPTR